MAVVDSAMILAAGLGSRLRPLTDVLAKPLVPVGDRPAIAHVAARLREGLPAARIAVNAHHRPEELRTFCESEGLLVSDEPVLLGTAGGLAAAAPLLGHGDVAVWNGDILADIDVSALLAAHQASESRATLVVGPCLAGEGNVGLDARGVVVRLRTERFGEEVRGGVFMGIHVVGAALRERLPERGCLVGDVHLPALRAGERLFAYETSVPFVDVGTLEAYLAANRLWLEERGLPSWAHPTSKLAGSIDGSLIGAGAVVEAPVRDCVVWPGAEVKEPLTRAIVMPSAVAQV